MTVCLIIPSFYPATVYGGPIYSTLYSCQELAKLNINIIVASTNANKNKRLDVSQNIPIKFQDNFLVIYYNETIIGKFSLSLYLNIWKQIKHADIIHIQSVFSTPVPIAFLYAKIFKKTIVYSPRGALNHWGLQKLGFLKKIWIKILIKPFVKNIYWHVTSEQEKIDVLYYFPNAKLKIIPNGIFVDIYKPNVLFNNNIENSEKNKIIISMGRIHKVKGFDILIKSFSKILLKYPDSKLIIAGKNDGELNSLQSLSRELKVDQFVFFIGNIEGQNKIEFFRNADVFVLPSHTENFGNVYAEALAAGIPIVASTNTPWEEVEEAGCGRWVPNTVEDTTNAILDILSRDRETMRQKALLYVQKYDWKNIAFQFKELYENLV